MKNLVARGQFDVSPPFFVVGGLVFQPLSLELLQTWQDLKGARRARADVCSPAACLLLDKNSACPGQSWSAPLQLVAAAATAGVEARLLRRRATVLLSTQATSERIHPASDRLLPSKIPLSVRPADSPTHLMYMYSYGLPSPERKEVVVLTQARLSAAEAGNLTRIPASELNATWYAMCLCFSEPAPPPPACARSCWPMRRTRGTARRCTCLTPSSR